MRKGTLSLNPEATPVSIELPDDYDRLLQSITVCAPAQKISLDIDVTHKLALPAILESALLLVAQIETVSPSELGSFFGLTDHERDILVNEMIDTDLVRFNDEGDIATTPKLIAQRREGAADGGITIEDVENFREITFVDLCTGHIQPRSEADKQLGLPMLPRKVNLTDFSQIFAKQFHRFQACLPDLKSKKSLRSSKAHLYRINRASVMQSGLQQQVSLDIHARHDPLYGIRLDARLLDYKKEHSNLIDSSGLKTEAVDWIHNRLHEPATISLQQYCDIVRDPVIERYIKHGDILDLPRLLHDRFRAKTGYGHQNTRMMIGPIYSAANRKTITSWVDRHSKNKRMHQGVWLGATNQLFGASLGLESFMKEINYELNQGERRSSLNLAFHLGEGHDSYDERSRLKNTLSQRTDCKLCTFVDGTSESHMELMVFPGENGCALAQYHAKIDTSLGFGGLTIPLGYFTIEPDCVAFLWEQVRKRINSNLTPFDNYEINLESLNKQLKYAPQSLNKLLEDESAQLLKNLVDKFNRFT
ncbi:hypothetical protein KKI93_03740 [Xenorhabdus bovienii]|uniref:hypothetical protein n=1 Tax=Xenorhabdus bovienii TaxID=40576 RepID=UPI0023B2ECB1|nr:hypothetical protein [Xenorhabdus bovienii]MDE9563204.1 hypothetical protein [Xenorhabdus bovienii]